ncbi:YihY/virulence factor BrkB family protein [Petrocella sp. FN5]|uniref:YihY/virulence factor BrkB family protein n=1 Tax=Petrocella sp. FN5 TaxID=3032002 RepID=UPI0023DA4801|nr:YihY/virulence factor BrkB family protein [Petrocella sp. FN5]MDF1618387.1 YihY/virulence factor BrkB family protein [Petrocella sp. FN5]
MAEFIKKLKQLFTKIDHDDITAWASMLTLFLMLSLFPLIILITDFVASTSFNDPAVTDYLIAILPAPIFETIQNIATDIELNRSTKVIPAALLVTAWAASKGILAIIQALNKAYDVVETRSYIKLRFLALFYTLGFILLIVLSLILIVFGNTIYGLIESNITVPEFISPIVIFLRFTITIVLSMIFFIFLYNLSPTVKVGFIKVLPGAVFSSLGLVAASSAFSIYVKYSTSLSYLYGSLTGFMALILWLFFISLIIMVGGEINAVFLSSHFKHL